LFCGEWRSGVAIAAIQHSAAAAARERVQLDAVHEERSSLEVIAESVLYPDNSVSAATRQIGSAKSASRTSPLISRSPFALAFLVNSPIADILSQAGLEAPFETPEMRNAQRQAAAAKDLGGVRECENVKYIRT